MSEERKFKVGDKVRVISSIWSKPFNDKIGTVINANRDGASVEFDEFIDGHDSSGAGKPGHCWFFSFDMGDRLEIVKEHDWKVLIMSEGDTTTARLYENGLVTKSVSTKKHPDDEYSMEIACKVLMDRLFPKTEIVKQDKYEVGDKVKIRDDLSSNKRYYMSDKKDWDDVSPSMMTLKGRVVTIKKVRGNGKYGIYELGYNWTDEMFEGKVVDKRKVETKPEPEEPNIKGFKIGDLVKVVDSRDIPIGVRGVVHKLDITDNTIGVDLKFNYGLSTSKLICGTGNPPLPDSTGHWFSACQLEKVK